MYIYIYIYVSIYIYVYINIWRCILEAAAAAKTLISIIAISLSFQKLNSTPQANIGKYSGLYVILRVSISENFPTTSQEFEVPVVGFLLIPAIWEDWFCLDPNVSPISALWSLFDGIWAVLKCS